MTGEAVGLELRPAKLPSRILALAIDLLLQGVLLFVGALAASVILDTADEALGATVALVLVVGVLVGWPVAWETLTRGRSPGKMALGLRVLRDDGGPIGFRQALVRALFGVFIDFYVTSGVVGLVSSLASAQGRRVGDYAAGTLVVRERAPHQGGPTPAMPPMLAGWARTLDLAVLPDDLALAARQYVSRIGQLGAASQADMGERLAEAVSRHVSPPPPPGTPPWAYLSAVLVERRTREEARLRARATPGISTGTRRL